MSEEVKPAEKLSDKIKQEFAHVCAQVGESIHRLDLLKEDQKKLQAAYNKALEDEKPKDEEKPKE